MKRPTSRPSKPLTNKQIFAKVWKRFVVEKSPRCKHPIGQCKYDDVGDVKGCAVGCMLTKADAKKFDKTGSISFVIEKHPILFSKYFSLKSKELLSDLQAAHDSIYTNMKEELTEIKDRYSL